MNSDAHNHYELVSQKTVKGKFKHIKRLVALSYWLIPIVLFVICATFADAGLAAILTVVFVLAAYIVKLCTWPYLDIVEYEYIIDKGVMTANFVRGKKIRIAQSGKGEKDRSITKNLATVRLEDFTLVAPYEGEYKEKADKTENFIQCANTEAMNLYVGFFKDDAGRDSVILFETENKCIKLIKYFNRDNTVVKALTY